MRHKDTTLGAYLRQARESAGLSLRDLENLTGVGRMALSRLENDAVQEPQATDLVKLARALDVDEAALLAYIGVQPTLPEPRMYFRRKLGVNADEADVLAQLIEDY